MRPRGKKDLICLDEPKSVAAEAFRTLRSNIQFAGFNKDQRVLLVTSAEPGEGKTTTMLNLGIVMMQANQKVLLIDADMRKPSVHVRLCIPAEPGLSNLLINQVEATAAIQHVPETKLDVITSGTVPPNPAELLNSPKMGEILQLVKREYDYVLIDSPPLLPATDAQVLSRYVDGTLMVINSGKAEEENVRKAKSLLELAGANLMGFVLNNTKSTVANYYM